MTNRPYSMDDFEADIFRAASWDLWVPAPGRDPPLKLVDTLDELRSLLPGLGMTLEHFLTLPVARAMPEKLRREVDQWRSGRRV